MSETIENNMRKTIIQEMPVNPAYYEKMSVLLLELIRLRKQGVITYEELLKKYEELAHEIHPNTKVSYPKDIDTKPKQALYDNLEKNIELATALDDRIVSTKDNDWRGTFIKRRKVEIVIRQVLNESGISDESEVNRIFELVTNQKEY
jgi:type I restriction enzyme R subunit